MINYEDLIASIVILVGAVLLIIVNVYRLNSEDKTWKENKKIYVQIIAMILITISMLMKITIDK